MIITIDGPASVGKGTLSKRVAEYFNLDYFDTGMIYRAVGIEFFINNTDINNQELAEEYAQKLTFAKMHELAKHPEFRGAAGGRNAAVVASYPKVRRALLKMQRDFAANSVKGAVFDGRDTGTVVCPDADLKFFITAKAEVRAERRYKEFIAKGIDIPYEQVLKDIIERDERDTNRASSPLRAADDAFIIDTSYLNADEAFEKTKEYIERKISI